MSKNKDFMSDNHFYSYNVLVMITIVLKTYHYMFATVDELALAVVVEVMLVIALVTSSIR